MENLYELYYPLFDIASKNLNQADIDKYKKLRELYKAGINAEFKELFKSYYGLNIAGLTEEQKSVYFLKLSELSSVGDYATIFLDIATKLYDMPRRTKDNSLQLSFTTKLLAFVDDNYPIYDKYVGDLFGLGAPDNGSVPFRVKVFLHNMALIKSYYEYFSKKKEMRSLLDGTKNKFSLDASDIRIMDFYVWSIGKKKYTLSYPPVTGM